MHTYEYILIADIMKLFTDIDEIWTSIDEIVNQYWRNHILLLMKLFTVIDEIVYKYWVFINTSLWFRQYK